MSRPTALLLAFLVGAAAGAAGLHLLPEPGADARDAHVAGLEESLADARRDAHDYAQVARAERRRRAEIEEEVERLRIQVAVATPSEAGAATDAGHMGHAPPSEGPGLLPAEWDQRRLREELTRLSLSGPQMSRSPLIDRCAEAARTQGEAAVEMLVSVLRVDGMDPRLVRAAAMVLGQLNDQSAVKTLTERWEGATELSDRRAFLRALANIDGAAQVATLVAAWRDATLDPRLRLLAIHGLAMRKHPIAIGLVTSPAAPGEEGLRARAIESLHVAARRTNYEDRQLIPALSTALLTADGEAQTRIALLGLEGFWDAGCVPALREFVAAGRGPEDVRERAASIADAIEAGAPRPERAGQAREPNRRMDDE